MVLGYISSFRDNVDNIKFEIQQYAKKNKLKLDQIIVDEISDRSSWEKRAFHSMIQDASHEDIFVLFEASDVARSTSQVLEALDMLLEHGVTVHFVKYDQIFKAVQEVNVLEILTLMQYIESDFVAKRTTEALARRRAAGLPLGRPRGKLNKSLKLDKYKKEIMRYLELKISKASIAKLVGCHPQTLYNYLEKRNLTEHLVDDEEEEIKQYHYERELEPLD